MEMYVKCLIRPCFHFFWFTRKKRFHQMRWLYPYRSFKHSKWWRHKL